MLRHSVSCCLLGREAWVLIWLQLTQCSFMTPTGILTMIFRFVLRRNLWPSFIDLFVCEKQRRACGFSFCCWLADCFVCSIFYQAFSRAHRIGQNNKVHFNLSYMYKCLPVCYLRESFLQNDTKTWNDIVLMKCFSNIWLGHARDISAKQFFWSLCRIHITANVFWFFEESSVWKFI